MAPARHVADRPGSSGRFTGPAVGIAVLVIVNREWPVAMAPGPPEVTVAPVAPEATSVADPAIVPSRAT